MPPSQLAPTDNRKSADGRFMAVSRMLDVELAEGQQQMQEETEEVQAQ